MRDGSYNSSVLFAVTSEADLSYKNPEEKEYLELDFDLSKEDKAEQEVEK
ncbi:MAG TPA: hypothetical protein VH797_01295 [Nitrososphaeraceae archaeon]